METLDEVCMELRRIYKGIKEYDINDDKFKNGFTYISETLLKVFKDFGENTMIYAYCKSIQEEDGDGEKSPAATQILMCLMSHMLSI